MPITIQHGLPEAPGLAGMAQTAMQIAAAERAGGAGVGGVPVGGRAGPDPAAMAGYQAELKAFYGEQAAEQEYELEVQKMQEQARVQAELFEYKFTTKQRHELAQLENTDQMVQTDPRFADVREEWNSIYAQKKAGITPRSVPRDPNKAVYPEGQGIGEVWEQHGGVMGRDSTGKPFIVFRPDQMPEYLERQEEIKQAQAQRDKEAESRKYWSRQEVDVPPERPGGEVIKRRMKPEEVRERMEGELSWLREEREAAEAEARLEDEERFQQSGLSIRPHALIEWSRGVGVQITEAEADMPEYAALAQAALRRIRKEKKIKGPHPGMVRAFQEARAILSRYKETLGAAR